MKIKPLIVATLLTSSIFGTQAFAKELAVCTNADNVPDLFEEIACQDTTKSLKDGQSDTYTTTLYQLYKQGWKIVAVQDGISTEYHSNAHISNTHTSYVQIYLEK